MKDINKKINKRVRFDFYREEINNNEEKNDIIVSEENVWSFEKMFDYYIKYNELKTNLNIEDEEIEIEPNSLFKENNLYFFLISNLRNDIIPAKKKIGKEKKDIILDDDEYIGEFTGVVYDNINKIFMFQINKYGINPTKIQKYLKALKDYYISSLTDKNIENVEFSLNMILNPKELETVADSKEIRSIHLKSSSSSLAQLKKIADEDEKNCLKEISEVVSMFGNINFEINITANFKEEKSLEKETAKSFINSLKKYFIKEKKDISFSVTRRKDDDSNVDTIDFLLPKMIKYITLSVEPRKSIGRDQLRFKMFEGYLSIRDKLIKIILG